MLANGAFVIVEIPEANSQYEDSKVDELKPTKNPLKILTSVSLPNCSILDFDIDRNCYFISLLTSEGNIILYDIATLEKNEKQIISQKLKSASMSSISYQGSFKYISEKEFEIDVKNYSAFIPEEGILSKDSIRMKDSGIIDLNNSTRRSCGHDSRVNSAYKPNLEPPSKINYKNLNTLNTSRDGIEEIKGGNFQRSRFDDSSQKLFSDDISSRAIPTNESNILIYKEGVPDMQDYGSFINDCESQNNPAKKAQNLKSFNGRPTRKPVSISIDGGEVNMSKLKPILRKYYEYPEMYRKSIWENILECPGNKSLSDYY